MTTQETVREAAVDDIDAIQRISRETWHEVYDDILGPDVVEEVLADLYVEEALEASISHESQDFFVAIVDDDIVGYAHAGPHPPLRIFRLYRVFIEPDHRRDGIATHLLARVEEALVDRDRDKYDALTLESNADFLAFLESTGFERVETENTDRRGVGVTECRYVKPI